MHTVAGFQEIINCSSYEHQKGVILAIGNFDGCHLGHQDLISKTVALAREHNRPSAVMTFSPRPEIFFQNLTAQPSLAAPSDLFSASQKRRALSELGVDIHIEQPFTEEFAAFTHEEFYEKILKQSLNIRGLVAGHDFRFGHCRCGDVDFLERKLASDGKIFVDFGPRRLDDHTVSSSLIRKTIGEEGNVALGAMLLGRPYLFEGEVVRGRQLGRTIGIPTANIGSSDGYLAQLLPKPGVYSAFAVVGKKPPLLVLPKNVMRAVVNIGFRPTVSDGILAPLFPTVEAHMIGQKFGVDELYGERIGLYFTKKIRDEKKFLSLEALKEQIERDIEGVE